MHSTFNDLALYKFQQLKVDNFFHLLVQALVQTFEEDDDPIVMVEQMINKMQLIARMHEEITKNVN
jgi:hypothetical protein